MHGAYDKPWTFACWDLKSKNKSVYTIVQAVGMCFILEMFGVHTLQLVDPSTES